MIHKVWSFLEWFEPHLVWIIGGLVVLDSVYWQQWVGRLATEPRAFLFVFGILVFISGRTAIRERKKKYRKQREIERLERDRDAWKVAFEDCNQELERKS